MDETDRLITIWAGILAGMVGTTLLMTGLWWAILEALR